MELATVQSLLLLRLTVTLAKFGMQAENPKLDLVIRIVLLPGKRFSFFVFASGLYVVFTKPSVEGNPDLG